MKVLVIPPAKYPKVLEIDESIEDMKEIVNGPFDECFIDENVAIIYNPYGKTQGLPFNRESINIKGEVNCIYYGTFFICGAPNDKEDCYESLSEEQIQYYSEKFNNLLFFLFPDNKKDI